MNSTLSPPAVTVVALPARNDFLLNHLLIPVVALLAISTLLMAGNGDQWLADHIYQLEGGRWLLRDAWVTSHLIHHGGKSLSVLAAVLTLVTLLWASVDARGQRCRRPLLYLLLTVALSTGLVSLLKSAIPMDCPWDLSRYGGFREFVGLFETRPDGMPGAACFPGGHASAGYAWVSLYFVALVLRPAWRWPALALPLLVGAIFGIGQQLRGAHFLSHDVWALGISWLLATVLYLWMFRPGTKHAPPASISTTGEMA
jgi:membrane-associated PAP2 superfamily phosphatase